MTMGPAIFAVQRHTERHLRHKRFDVIETCSHVPQGCAEILTGWPTRAIAQRSDLDAQLGDDPAVIGELS
jgi:hypothetical protein